MQSVPVRKPEGTEDLDELELFLATMDEFPPVIPDEVTSYFLNRTGFDCPDVRVSRMIGLAAQKLISDVSNDALQYCKLRHGTPGKTKQKGKLVLAMDDLTSALTEYGITIRKPEYFADSSSLGKDGERKDEKDRFKITSSSDKSKGVKR